ncbi:unnamed protein product, partial [Mesorhabditis belari]|uniref:C-type lectin domain-containing protein n=1 Tax=Mesorhabditis belari TaxID=2138241 RepID=A0AAF3JAW4_9BILA
MASFWRHFLLLSLVTSAVFTQCPNGGYGVPNENVCVYLFPDADFYYDVIHKCATVGGIPAKVVNIYENSFIYALVSSLTQKSSFIGVEKLINGTWTYADGTPLSYQNWADGEPKLKNNTSQCVLMDGGSGKWMTTDCSTGQPFICTVGNEKPPQQKCADGWVYNNRTNFCYFLQGFSYSDSLHWDMYNVTIAEANCKKMDAHLVSIHSEEENNFVLDLVHSNVKNESSAAPDHNPCGYLYAKIGLYGNGLVGSGSWTDGTPVDWTPFATSRGSYWHFAIVNDDYCDSKEWIGDERLSARFVCKKPSTSQTTKKQ